MSLSPSSSTVAHAVPTENGSGRRGPRGWQEIEESSPVGRALHFLEGLAFTGAESAVYYRQDRDARLDHDAQADHHVESIASAAALLLDRSDLDADHRTLILMIQTHVQGYRLHDALEDAAAFNGDNRVSVMHTMFRRVAAFVERSCSAIRFGVNA